MTGSHTGPSPGVEDEEDEVFEEYRGPGLRLPTDLGRRPLWVAGILGAVAVAALLAFQAGGTRGGTSAPSPPAEVGPSVVTRIPGGVTSSPQPAALFTPPAAASAGGRTPGSFRFGATCQPFDSGRICYITYQPGLPYATPDPPSAGP